MQSALTLAAAQLPADSRRSFVRSAYYEIDSELTCLVTSDDAMLRWNMHGMRRMRDDLEALDQFAATQGRAGNATALSGLTGLCDFLLSDDWHLVQSPAHLRSEYPTADFVQVRAPCVCACAPWAGVQLCTGPHARGCSSVAPACVVLVLVR